MSHISKDPWPCVTSGDHAGQHSVRGIKEPNPEGGLLCKPLVSFQQPIPDMNKRNCSRFKDTEITKQTYAVCGSGLDPGLNKPGVKDLKTS